VSEVSFSEGEPLVYSLHASGNQLFYGEAKINDKFTVFITQRTNVSRYNLRNLQLVVLTSVE